MTRYRKKPVVIDVVEWRGDMAKQYPDWFMNAWRDKTIVRPEPLILTIKTLEGDMRADAGDWIIKGVRGEIYPCKPDIFAATYEPV